VHNHDSKQQKLAYELMWRKDRLLLATSSA